MSDFQENVPIFIGGCDRSGTTMLGALIGAVPGVLCLPEAPFIARCVPEDDPLSADAARALLEKIATQNEFTHWDCALDPMPADMGAFEPYAQLVQRVVDAYTSRHGPAEHHMWVDHTPINVLHFASLLRVFPTARFIHMYRDGRAVAASIIAQDWGPNDVIRAARFWISRVGLGFAAGAALPADRLLQVRYETLLAEPELETRRIAAFLGLEWSEAMLSTAGLKLPSQANATHELIGKPLDAGRVDAWRRTLAPWEIECFEVYAGDLLRYLGYDLVTPAQRTPGRLHRAVIAARSAIRQRANRIKFRRRYGA